MQTYTYEPQAIESLNSNRISVVATDQPYERDGDQLTVDVWLEDNNGTSFGAEPQAIICAPLTVSQAHDLIDQLLAATRHLDDIVRVNK